MFVYSFKYAIDILKNLLYFVFEFIIIVGVLIHEK